MIRSELSKKDYLVRKLEYCIRGFLDIFRSEVEDWVRGPDSDREYKPASMLHAWSDACLSNVDGAPQKYCDEYWKDFMHMLSDMVSSGVISSEEHSTISGKFSKLLFMPCVKTSYKEWFDELMCTIRNIFYQDNKGGQDDYQ